MNLKIASKSSIMWFREARIDEISIYKTKSK